MASFFIAVGGTGQMVALSHARLMGLMPWLRPAQMYHMDRDNVARFTDLVASTFIDPLPAGAGTAIGAHFTDPAYRPLCVDVLDALLTSKEQQTAVGSGMYGHPPVGAAMIVDRLGGGSAGGLNEILDGDPIARHAYLRDGSPHTVVVCGSAMGGTGAGGVPSLAQHIDLALGTLRANIRLYVLYLLQHFNLRPDRSDRASEEQETIVNAQVVTNARSGMCYLADKIVKGTDGCLLLGLEVAPSRNYEPVGKQTEQLEPLHVLAAVYAQFLFGGGQLPGRYNAHAIGLQPQAGRILAKELGVNVAADDGRTASLDRLVQLNTAAARFLSRLAHFLLGNVGFAFVSPMPREIDKALGDLTKVTKDSRATVEKALSSRLSAEENRIDALLDRFDSLRQERVPFSLDFRKELDGSDYLRSLSRPLGFMRNWSKKLRFNGDELSYDRLCEALLRSLYECLDEAFFKNDFGLGQKQ